jgi:molecular chaperone GrpE
MTDPTARQGDDAVAETETAPAKPEMQAPAEAEKPAEAPDPLAEARREAAEYKDRLLRTLAEMDNLRKRTEREVADARLYGIASFAREVLAVADNMHRALAAIGSELREKGDAQIKALIEGVELTERELLKALEKCGVRKFSPQGDKFDPNVHQAMFELETADVPPGHVAQVIQAGYMIGERVLRPALVAVSRAPKPQPAPAAEASPTNDNTN